MAQYVYGIYVIAQGALVYSTWKILQGYGEMMVLGRMRGNQHVAKPTLELAMAFFGPKMGGISLLLVTTKESGYGTQKVAQMRCLILVQSSRIRIFQHFYL